MSIVTDTNVVNVVYKEGHEKPWHIEYDEVSMLQTARAAINYPKTQFETEEEAVEVATMIRDIIHANSVDVLDETGDIEILDDTQKAPFFKRINREDNDDISDVEATEVEHEETSEDRAVNAVNDLTDEQIRRSQENNPHVPSQVDPPPTFGGPSQTATQKELGIDEPYAPADVPR